MTERFVEPFAQGFPGRSDEPSGRPFALVRRACARLPYPSPFPFPFPLPHPRSPRRGDPACLPAGPYRASGRGQLAAAGWSWPASSRQAGSR